MCLLPLPSNLCTQAAAGNAGKELPLKEKGNGSHGLALDQLEGPCISQHDVWASGNAALAKDGTPRIQN